MINTREKEVKDKKEKLLKLIDGKAYKIANILAEERHKSISHYGKEQGEFLVNVAKEAILDDLIVRLNKL